MTHDEGADDGDDPDHRLHHVHPDELSETTFTDVRDASSRGDLGRTQSGRARSGRARLVPAATGSGNHHHGKSETGIYVVEGIRSSSSWTVTRRPG